MDYSDLYRVWELLGLDVAEYEKMKMKFDKDKSSCIKEYLDCEDDGEIKNFSEFWYYYLADNTNCIFHNIGVKGYTESIEKFLIKNKIEIENIDFSAYKEKEAYYSETLFDILISDVRYSLKDKKLDIFGINVGYDSLIYYILPKDVLKEIKKIAKNYLIFDCEKLEELYGEIFKLKQDIPNYTDIKVGDFIEKDKKTADFYTLFDPKVKQNYKLSQISEDNLELYL